MTIQYRRQLPDLLRYLNLPMIACECGCAEGYFSADLLRAGMEKLYMCDLWGHIPKVTGDGNAPQPWHDQNFMLAKRRVKEFGNRAVILRGKTVEMASRVPDDSLSLLYLDADHSYNGVMGDLKAWFSKVINGGVIATHDYENPAYGVKQAFNDFCKNKYVIQLLPEDKLEDAGAFFIKTS